MGLLILTRLPGQSIVIQPEGGKRERVDVIAIDRDRRVHVRSGSGLHQLWPDESITASGCTITLVAVRGKQARLGFDAPRSTTVHRLEIQQRIDAEAAA